MTDPNPDNSSESSAQQHFDSLAEEVQPDLVIINEKYDPTVWEKITSHRAQFGSLIVLIKKIFGKLLQPIANILLRRQIILNAHLVRLLNKMVAHLDQELFAFRHEVENLDAKTGGFHLKVDELRQENILNKKRLEHLLSEMRKKYDLPQKAVTKIIAAQESLWDHDYFLFENQFRGNQEDISKCQEFYVPFFKNASHVLDIGCGRGEFLSLLQNEGIKAFGIDLNEDMIHLCQEKGLEVQKTPVFPYLNSLEDTSLGGIFASHIIEHLETATLRDFIKLCYRKLKKGALIACETPNPLSIIVSSTNFYLDISHIKPLHPQAIKFLLDSCGFGETKIKYLSPFPEEAQLQPLSPTGKPSGLGQQDVQRYNQNVEKLNKLLYGFQDYAVVGKKL